ncbi:MAG: type II secretion system F family protein [Clostridia bacterium]|nr:type II secretion system F family protein [Clostridia bacterium]
MPTYQYKAMAKNGRIVKNTVTDDSKAELFKKLKKNGLTPISIQQAVTLDNLSKMPKMKHRTTAEMLGDMSGDASKMLYDASNHEGTKKKGGITITTTSKKIKVRDIMIFTQSFMLLKKADFNNVHALETVIRSTENPRFRDVLKDILRGVEAGEYMFSTMEYYSNIFPPIYVNMIKVGELSGSLTVSLEQAMNYLETSQNLIKRVKKIVIPNLLQFIGLIVLLLVGTIVAIPSIQDVFDAVGTDEELPEITQWFSGVITSAGSWWYYPVLIIAAITGAIMFYIHTPNGRFKFDTFKYKMPIFGPLIYSVDFSRVMKAVSLNIKNGMRIQQALEVSQNVVKNNVMLSILEVSINNCMLGKSWIEPFEDAGLGNSMTTEMLKVGMQTDLATMMDKLLEFIEMDIDNILSKIMKVLPEVSYIFVGIVLIFFVVVVLVPCIQVYMGSFMFSAYL